MRSLRNTSCGRHVAAADAVRDGAARVHGGHARRARTTRCVRAEPVSGRQVRDAVACDVLCTGRFYDFFEKRDERWAIVLRQPIYEKDRIDPIDPGTVLKLDASLLVEFPEGYRHLAYAQTRIGFTVKRDILWESDTASRKVVTEKEIELILRYRSNDPAIGYNRWPPMRRHRVRG